MAKIVWPGGTLLAPVPPALVTTGTMEAPNVCTVAWCGILNSNPPKTYVSIRPERYSYELLKNNGEFVINLPTTGLIKSVDYCGVRSGRNEDKFKACGLEIQPADMVAPPLITRSPINIECRVFEVVSLGTHDMFMADILAMDVDEELIDEKGKLHLDKSGLLAYAHGEYFALGKKLGSFGYSVRRKKKR